MKIIRNHPYIWMMLLIMSISACKLVDPPLPQANVEDLAGEWVRVLSNNPTNDGMVLRVTGNNGTITDKAGSGFSNGDIKWKGLTPAEAGLGYDFDYEELGSDANYYQATMRMDGDTAYVDIASSGAGNTQKWVKKSAYTDPGPSAETIILDCSNISGPTTLENGPAAIDYLVPNGCVLDVTDALVIEAGTVIAFEENSGIGVYDNGSIKAVGNESTGIVFQGKEGVKGYWRGIHIETNSLNNQFDYVTIRDAGANYVYCCNEKASVILKGGKLSIKHTEILNGAEFGLYVTKDGDLAEFSEVRISTHDNYPMGLSMELLGQLDGTASQMTGNTRDNIFVYYTSVADETSVPAMDVPYLLEGKVMDIINKLTLEAGVEMAFEENGGLGVYDNGALTLAGTSEANVILRGKEASSGFWRGIHIETNSNSNDFNYAAISDAGGNYVYCCNTKASLFLKAGKLKIRNTSISNGAEYGIATQKDFSFNGFENVNITSHAREPMYLSITQTGQLDGMDSDFSGNTQDYLLIYNSDLTSPITMPKTNVPFGVETNVVLDIRSALTMSEGLSMSVANGAGLGFYDSGTINADASGGEKITIIGREATKGLWRGIHLETVGNVMKNVELRHAGSNYVYCCNEKAAILLKGGDLVLTGSNIADNDGCGVFVKSGGILQESGNTFSNNTDGNICN